METQPPWGEGPGAITRDGCAVEVYLRLPYRDELNLLAGHLPAGCSVLELGCGTGRLTRRLLEQGFAVTAVDNSADMLRHVPDAAAKVECDIERLALSQTFAVVLLASNLINTDDESLRQTQLGSCRRHVAPGGTLLFQRFDPDWLRVVEPGAFPSIDDVAIRVERAVHRGKRVDMSVEYSIGETGWKHHFTARILDDEEVTVIMRKAGFDEVKWIDRRWGAARAVAAPK